MASVFSQSCLHPQAAVALSHLSSILGGARAMSTHKDISGTRARRELHTHKKSIHNGKPEKDLELLQVSDMVKVLSNVNINLTDPVTDLVNKSKTTGRSSQWSECHVSADTFFENKTGFPKTQLTHPPEPSLHLTSQDPLFRRIFQSLVQSSTQTRGFKTLRSQRKTIGVGGKKETQESFLDNMQGFLNSRSDKQGPDSKLSDVDPELDKRLKIAFAEGYRAKEESGSKKKLPALKIFLFTTLILWLMYKLLSSNVSIKTGGSLGFLNSISYEVNAEDVNVTFEDVKGAEEAKQELQDIVNFLRDPEKYTHLGAKLPKGVLLVGPPGVGKTLLARAVAGEAGVPFFHASGSEFDEMFVGLGAKRIRQLFSAAKEQAPCIIFIDEFDSVGAKRTSSAIHPYANQTVNQLLNEMDGFQQNEGIIVMGATNKVDNMDKALRRPGRFDVEVTVSLPDLKGRKEIIELYISKIKKDPNVDVDKLARGTTGLSGAELENLVNQAALKAVIDGQETVTMDHLEFARDKILMGPERKYRIPDEETNLTTAYHEAGHALVAYFTKDATPIHKVTIIPRGQSLGHTSFIDEKEIYNKTVSQLKASLDTSMGGRVAEELIYGLDKINTGAASDLEQATKVATAMVTALGMSEKVGLRTFNDEEKVSPAQREIIDAEIRRLLQEAYERAKNILRQHHTDLVNMAQALVKYETLDKDDMKNLLEGKKLKKSL